MCGSIERVKTRDGRGRRLQCHRDGPLPAGRTTITPASDCLDRLLRSAESVNIPGEDLPKVSHYYDEPHPYFDSDVLVIGGKNSAADRRAGSMASRSPRTLVHREPRCTST